ncbi:SLOG family protein [Streptomyces gardneri]|uniref:SLOG family protein n=1 Tax=Streptomyces gardneri TaxID=66892 RepID=UPI001144536F
MPSSATTCCSSGSSTITFVHGHCPDGADSLADAWARANGVTVEPHPAQRHPTQDFGPWPGAGPPPQRLHGRARHGRLRRLPDAVLQPAVPPHRPPPVARSGGHRPAVRRRSQYACTATAAICNNGSGGRDEASPVHGPRHVSRSPVSLWRQRVGCAPFTSLTAHLPLFSPRDQRPPKDGEARVTSDRVRPTNVPTASPRPWQGMLRPRKRLCFVHAVAGVVVPYARCRYKPGLPGRVIR